MGQIQIYKRNRFGHSQLGIGIYLEFGIWDFRRYALYAMRSALCVIL
jgi:hypothetical protein